MSDEYERHPRKGRQVRTQTESVFGEHFRQPLGRTEELKKQTSSMLQQPDAAEATDRHNRTEKEQGNHHTGRVANVLWGLVAVVCLILIITLVLVMAPQVLGVRYKTLPNLAFASGGMIQLDEGKLAEYRTVQKDDDDDRIYPGVYIDGVDVGGLTMEEARAQLNQVEAAGGGGFTIHVVVDDKTWTLDSSQVPLQRNLDDVLMQAYALGRQNTRDNRTSFRTPIQERSEARAALLAEPVNLETVLSYDMESVRGLTDAISAEVNKPAVSSSVESFDVASRTFGFTEDQSGVYLDGDELFNRVKQNLENGDYYSLVRMETEELIAPMTKAELMNAFHKISGYSTKTTSNRNRNTNISLSADAINGVMVEPGALFSFNQTTGQRTAEKGYKEATAISGGQTVPEIGGGVCQTSSTLFNAVARANLEIVSRSPHAWPSSYVEKGLDATVNWPGLDFQFRNNTEWPVYIVAWYDRNKVTVELYGMSLGDGITIDLESKVVRTLEAPSGVKRVRNESLKPGTEKIVVKSRKGYEVETYQVWYQNGEEIRRNLLCTSTYKAYQQTVEYN